MIHGTLNLPVSNLLIIIRNNQRLLLMVKNYHDFIQYIYFVSMQQIYPRLIPVHHVTYVYSERCLQYYMILGQIFCYFLLFFRYLLMLDYGNALQLKISYGNDIIYITIDIIYITLYIYWGDKKYIYILFYLLRWR